MLEGQRQVLNLFRREPSYFIHFAWLRSCTAKRDPFKHKYHCMVIMVGHDFIEK